MKTKCRFLPKKVPANKAVAKRDAKEIAEREERERKQEEEQREREALEAEEETTKENKMSSKKAAATKKAAKKKVAKKKVAKKKVAKKKVAKKKVAKKKVAKKVAKKTATKKTAKASSYAKQNGITHPREGGTCYKVWKICDSLVKKGVAPERKDAIAAIVAAKIDKGTAGVQFRKWSIYHGYRK